MIPSASLIPENDPSVLFTTAGMHPLVPYLMGQVHPAGKRLADVQKCVRTGDIDEVGDAMHNTFFEMLGNWSLGDYFKEEAITWSFELLTGAQWFGIDKQRLAVSYFAGDADVPRDEVSADAWRLLGIADARIKPLGKKDNWWPAGGKQPGPQGPDTEIFVWTGEGSAPAAFDSTDKRWVEVWNDVFMEFRRTDDGRYEPLAQKNVDTGMGLERMLMVLEGKSSVYETDLFRPIISQILNVAGVVHEAENIPTSVYPLGVTADRAHAVRLVRIIADHIRAVTFILGDPFGVAPSNIDQGYVVRKLIRRAIRSGKMIEITPVGDPNWTPAIADAVICHYRNAYPELENNRSRILHELQEEEERFREVLEDGTREAKKFFVPIVAAGGTVLSGDLAFHLYQSFGFPLELTEDLAHECQPPLTVDRAGFEEASRAHQAQSRVATGQRFQGGLADHSDQSIRYHTATHLTHQALRAVLGPHVEQRGSNITPERMRFDFTHGEKLTPEQVAAVQQLVQQQIDADLCVSYTLMDAGQAKDSGVIGLFDDQYAALGGKVKVYSIGDPGGGYFSREICGGPHVARTGMIGKFRIAKEEAVARGVRRIRAIVDPTPGGIAIASAHG